MALYRGDVSILDTMKHAPNPQIMTNMATMYAVKDLANILINKRIAATTVLHHLCVFIAYVYVLRYLYSEDQKRNLHILIILIWNSVF